MMTDSISASSGRGPSSPPLRALLLLALFFFLGAAAGIGGSGLWVRAKMKAAITDPQNADGAFLRRIDRIEAKLFSELNLTPEERSTITKELQRAGEQFKASRVDFLDSLQSYSVETRSRIEQSLPPEKREACRSLMQEGAFW